MTKRQRQTVYTLAIQLGNDLTANGLERYVQENNRMITNEIKYGRSPARYKIYSLAGQFALMIRSSI